MKILIVGATGYVGSAIAQVLKAYGHEISGLARSDSSAKTLRAAGITPVIGDLSEPSVLIGPIVANDVVIFAAKVPFESETSVIEPILNALEGSGKTFLFTSGTSCLSIETPNGEWSEESFAEDDPFELKLWTSVRVECEHLVRAAASRGIRAMVIRPPMIWGNGGGNGQVPWIFQKVPVVGAACYLGHGLNLYSGVHVDDLAEVYALAIARGTAGALYHAVSGEVNWRTIAEAIAWVMQCPTRSVTYREMQNLWGERDAPYRFAVSSRSRSPRAHNELGWQPRHLDLIEDIRTGSYRARFQTPKLDSDMQL